MNLNEYQKSAVNEPPKNITVSAAAGSGKTQVLGARVLERISGENPVAVNRLLIVTFTKSAAAEMRSRIGKAVTEALKTETDPEKKKNLQKQLSLLGGADICTIDSFCSRILRQNFFRVPGLSSDFTLGDEKAASLISAECFKRIADMFGAAADTLKGKELIPYYRRAAQDFFALYPDREKAESVLEGFSLLSMNYGSARNVSDFMRKSSFGADYVNFVYTVKALALSLPDPDGWLDLCIRDFCPQTPLEENRINAYAAQAAERILNDCIYLLEEQISSGNLGKANAAAFSQAVEKLSSIEKPRSYSDAVGIFSQKPLAGIRISSKSTKASEGNPEAARLMNRIRKDIWDGAGKIFCEKPNAFEIFREEIYPVVLALCELARCLIKMEEEELLKEKKLSFSACVKLTLELLVNPDSSLTQTALELRERYDEIYVDEAQDIDPRQKAIFDAISNGNLFMVGDVKQSIYGFRHAEPEIFNERCFCADENSRLITMNINYRSNKAVIDAVNSVFSPLMNRRTFGADYAQMHKMEHGEAWLPKDNPKAEFIAVIGDENSSRRYDFELEAQAIANEINRLLNEGVPVYDKARGEIRPIMKKDIIVLLRTVREDGPVLEKILAQNNIACYFDGGDGLFGKSEITAVTDVLTVVDNPLRDIPLAGMLRSMMFCFTENDLLRIRSVSNAKSFGEVFYILSHPSHADHEEYTRRLSHGELSSRCLNVGRLLEKWHICASFGSVSRLIGMILDDTEFYASVGAMENGEKRRANLELLISEARSFEANSSRGLYEFLNYIKKQSLSFSGSVIEAKTLSDSMDVVRIMSIHKSKGLEAPVVILGKCSKASVKRTSSVSVCAALGFCTDYINEDNGFIHRSPMNKVIELFNREKESLEEVRLLYVAMTRPRERLIFTGYFSSEKAFEDCKIDFGNACMSDIVFSANSFAKMLAFQICSGAIDQRIIPSANVSAPKAWKKLEGALFLSEDTVQNFHDLLGFSYENKKLCRLPAKLSVSAVNEELSAEAEVAVYEPKGFFPPLKRPSFLANDFTPSAAEIGTAYHTVMENLDFSSPIEEQIARLEEKGLIAPCVAKSIDADKIRRFTQSPLGQRMKAARLHREAPFMIKLPAREVLPLVEVDSSEEIALQGIIDCYFEENDCVVIVDFKTDKYTNPIDIAKKYEKQLYFYEKAVKMKFSDKKIKKYLYLFYKNDIIEL